VTGVSTEPSDPHDQENTTLVADLSSDGYSGDVTVTFTWDGSTVGSVTTSISSGLSTSAETYQVVSAGSHDLQASIDVSDEDGSNNDASTTVEVADYQTFAVNWDQGLGGEPLNLPHSSGTLYTMASGTITALDAGSGDLLWETSTGHNVEDTSSPILADGRLFYGENQGNQAVGFSISSQSVDWTYRTGYSVRSGAAYAGGTVFMGSDDGTMYAYGATDGSVQWTKGGGQLRAAPTVAGSTVYIPEWGESGTGTIYARDTGSGSQQWAKSLGGSIEQSKPYVDSSRVYVGALDGNLYALDRSSGSIDWQFNTGGGIRSSPAKADGMIVVGGGGGTVYSVWAANGTKAWEFQTSSSGAVNGHPAIADGTAYIGAPNGMFYGLDLQTGERTCEYNTGTGSIRTKPTVVGDSVYVGTSSNDVFSFQTCPA
jgi:outer membrane protein assembly factor BamB